MGIKSRVKINYIRGIVIAKKKKRNLIAYAISYQLANLTSVIIPVKTWKLILLLYLMLLYILTAV